MKVWHGLLIQFLATEVVSLFAFGLAGYWVVGLVAPAWGIALPVMIFVDESSGKLLAFVPFILLFFILPILAGVGRIERALGHVSLLLYSLLSIFTLVAFK